MRLEVSFWATLCTNFRLAVHVCQCLLSLLQDIKRATHRYYESRRRLGIEEMPDRQEKAAEQRKKRKYRARQQRAYDR